MTTIYPMHKTTARFAIRHHLPLVRDYHGHYFLNDDRIDVPDWFINYSMNPTAQSGIALMKRYLRWRREQV